MGQFNLVQLCVRSRASRCSKITRRMGVKDWWNTLACSGPSVPVSACIKQLLLKSLKARQWGQEEFERRGLYGDRSWVADSKLEERIIIWHTATEIYLYYYSYVEISVLDIQNVYESGSFVIQVMQTFDGTTVEHVFNVSYFSSWGQRFGKI
ncbi:hypothetical protein C2845_PM16G01000 [Panicum miliaceum]|uniref:Uncharacterized protein n=1 Tax=Panicum miliaceum TaxID=4540 RepID=A0A3L6PX65_PANMI|nr:hypothetical protein C2845_PM16G01000 [Panicum miliaceum]